MAREHSSERPGSQKQTVAAAIWNAILAGLGEPADPDRAATHLPASMAWPDFLAEVRRLRVASLVYAGLRTAARGTVPPGVLEALRRATLAVGVRAARLEQAAGSVIATASEGGISVLVLKGLALQKLVYPAGIVRSMDDVDLLVSPADSPRLGQLIRSRGYRNDLRGEEDFFASDLSHSMDLHTDLVNTTRLPARGALWAEPFQALWRRRQPCALGGAAAWTLGPADAVQHLAVHAVHHHGMQGVWWMADLLAALRTWPDAVHAVRTAPAGVRRSVWYCLEILAARGRDPAPDARAALRPRRLLPGEHRALAMAAQAACSGQIRYALTLVCLPSWAARAKFVGQAVFPSGPIYATGFSDSGQPPRYARLVHWGNLVRLAASRRARW
jgi:hypothetical protein